MKKLFLFLCIILVIYSCNNRDYPDTKMNLELIGDPNPLAYNGNVVEVEANFEAVDTFNFVLSELEWEIDFGSFINDMKSTKSKILNNSSSVNVKVDAEPKEYNLVACYSRKTATQCQTYKFTTKTSFPKTITVHTDTTVISEKRKSIRFDVYYTSGTVPISSGIVVTPSAIFDNGTLEAENVGRFSPQELKLKVDSTPISFTYTLNENAAQLDTTFNMLVDFDVRDINNEIFEIETLLINYKK